MTDLRNRDARRSRWLAAAIAADLLLVVMQAVACAMYRAPHTGDAQSYWELALYCAQNHTFYPSPRDEFALYIFGNGYVNLLSLLLAASRNLCVGLRGQHGVYAASSCFRCIASCGGCARGARRPVRR